jgi:predicted PolB exonuclease-like 3'-5' exonuclease
MRIPVAYFLDIETVPAFKDFADAPDWMQNCFKKKMKSEILHPLMNLSEFMQQLWTEKAALFAEFCQIVSISIGKITIIDNQTILKIKNIAGHDEKVVLMQFKEMIAKAEVLCAHNGKDFDFPILFRRMVINKIQVPAILNTIGKKPWDVPLEDTVEMWSGTAFKYRASLDLLTQSLGLESPKQDGVDGSQVGEIFYNTADLPFDNLKKISDYNNRDVVALAYAYCIIKQLEIVIEKVVYA